MCIFVSKSCNERGAGGRVIARSGQIDFFAGSLNSIGSFLTVCYRPTDIILCGSSTVYRRRIVFYVKCLFIVQIE